MKDLFERFPELESQRTGIDSAISAVAEMHICGGKLLLCGNGGSSSDCDHIAGELMKSFIADRSLSNADAEILKSNLGDNGEKFIKSLQYGVPAISLSSQSAILTAYINDVEPEMIYAQLLFVLAKSSDILFAISTSGKSKNIVNALSLAKSMKIKTIGLTGRNGGKFNNLCDILIKAPADDTYRIQEYHLPIYHHICMEIERKLYCGEL